MPAPEPPRPPPLSRFARIQRGYLAIALHTFNILVLFTAVNLGIAVWLRISPTPPPTRYNPSLFPKDKLAKAYGDMPVEVWTGTLDETWNMMKLEAKPWTHYGEGEFTGKYVNVSRDGVRSNGRREGPAPTGKPFRIFAFGGSTMWGYGVPDSETIASHLERALARRFPDRAVEVRNYGRGFYNNAQEMALFLSLLRSGEPPDAAVFFDGLNEAATAFSEGETPAFDRPAKMRDIEAMWKLRDAPPDRRRLPAWLPLSRLIDRIKSRAEVGTPATPSEPAPASPEITAQAREDAEVLLRAYALNRRVIEHAAVDAKVTPYFFLQPVPVHKYDLNKHLFRRFYGRRGTAAMRAFFDMVPEREKTVVNLSEMLAHYDRPAYVDAHHYSPEVCRAIAEEIAKRIVAPDDAAK